MVVAGPTAVGRRAVGLAAAVALAATGCGVLRAAEPEAVAQPGTVTTAPRGLSAGPYALTTEQGAVITFDLPTVPAPDHEVEVLRRDLRVEAVTYVELHIDNSQGTRAVQVEDLKVISHEGGQFPFEPAAEVLSDWDPDRSLEGGFWRADGTPLDPGEGARIDARTHALIAHYTGAVPAGGQGRELMIGDFEHLPASFDDVELSAYPHERALGPAPVGHGPDRLQYRAGRPPSSADDRVDAVQEPPARPLPVAGPVPAGPPPGEPVPAGALPGEPLPAEPLPAEPVPAGPAPRPLPAAEPLPGEPAPAVPGADPAAGTPVYAPDCADVADPAGPAEQAAWNEACAPVVADEPAPGSAPTPAVLPTPAAPPAVESSDAEDGNGGGASGATAPKGGTVERRPRPARSPSATPGPEPEPGPGGAQDPAAAPSGASSLPSTEERG